CWRADELDVAALADFSEVRVLGQKSVTGMNSIDIAHFRRTHNAIDFQITFRAGRGADADRFIRQLNMERIDIGFGINCECANAELLARADDAQRNLSAISDQDFLEHHNTRGRSGGCRTPYQSADSEQNLAELNR